MQLVAKFANAMTETMAYGYLSESTQRDQLSNEYQYNRV